MELDLYPYHYIWKHEDSAMDHIISGPSSPSCSKSTSSQSSTTDQDDDASSDHELYSIHVFDNEWPDYTTTLKKLCWLRSQIIGTDVEFETPFGRRRLIYADHTASGRPLRCIENFISTNVLPFYGNTHTGDSHVGHHTTKMMHEAAKYVKKCLGGGEEDAVIFCGSGSTAAIKRIQEVMSLAIPSILRDRVLKCLTNKERWLVFVGPYEHHSNILSWRSSLAEVVEIGLNSAGEIDVDALRTKLEFYKSSHRPPILGSFSACSNVTGLCTDTRVIARLLHEYGGFVCFDFAASGPYAKIDMRSNEIDGYDAIFLSTHKFLGGPGSPGILLMSKNLYRLGSSPPSTCGGGTVNFANGYGDKDTLYIESIEEREDAGTPPIIGKIRAALAFSVKQYIGYDAIEKQEQSYIQRALERLLPNPNIWILGNTCAKRQAILSFIIHSCSPAHDESRGRGLDLWRESDYKARDKPLHGPFIAKLLNDLFGIQARGGCACAGPYGHRLLRIDEAQSLALRSAVEKGYVGIKPGWARVSFPYYMAEEEFDYIISAIEFIALCGQRFLPLYHFNWKTGAWSFKKNALFEDSLLDDCASAACRSSLADMITALNLKDADPNIDQGQRYHQYFEKAEQLASLLPKFPAKRLVPDEIDANLVAFRV